MSQTIYYTFSTIPQVLAAVIALLGVFAIFRIQIFHSRIEGLAQNFYDILNDGVEKYSRGIIDSFITDEYILAFKKIKISRNYSQMLPEMARILERLKVKYDIYWDLLQPIYAESVRTFKGKEKLISITTRAIILSIIIIILCVTVLSFASIISNRLAWTLIGIVISLLGYNLFQIFKILKISIYDN